MATNLSMDENPGGTLPTRVVATSRLILGLAQGALLFGFYHAAHTYAWPATDGLLFAPLLLIVLFIPLIVSLGLGNMRTPALSAWAGVATLVLAGAAYFVILKSIPDWQQTNTDRYVAVPQILPPFDVFFFVSVWLFIAHVLVASGDADRRIVAHYRTQFDAAWKLAVQLALGALFVGVLWGVLYLGSSLFELINLFFLKRLMEHRWFAIPATTLAVSVAIHLTDVRASVVHGIRTILL
jgi:hypothetical protein